MFKSMKNQGLKRSVIESSIFLCFLYCTAACVYLNGDDFMYGTFAHTGIIRNTLSYYVTGNGRFWINVLDSLLLWFDRYAFVVLCPWIILAFVVLLAKNIQWITEGHADREKEQRYIRMGMVFFASLDVLCLRETVFWITGMMNYLFPAVILLLGYYLFQKEQAGQLHRASRILYYPVCFLAASSVEQFALMFVGLMTLHLGLDLLKKRLSGRNIAAYIVSLIGLAFLLLAPGNFVRVNKHGVEMPSFVDNAWTIVDLNTFSSVALPFIIMLTIAMFLYQYNSASLDIRHAALSGLLLVCEIAAFFLEKAVVRILLIIVISFQMLRTLKCMPRDKAISAGFLLFVGLGSQVMLLISAVWGFRCMFSMYLVYMLLIGMLVKDMSAEKTLLVLTSGIMTALHPVAALLYWAATLVLYLFHQRRIFFHFSKVTLLCGMVLSLTVLFSGYLGNAAVHRSNLENTARHQGQTVVIQELPNDLYSWYFVPFGEFHEDYYRLLYNIPDGTEIIYHTK